MTKWVGLGHGIYDYDPLWKNHVFWNEEDIAKIDNDDLQSPRMSFEEMASESEEINTDDLPSPRMSFEEMALESFESLMFQNLSCMRNGKYRKDSCFSQWRVGKCEVPLLRYKEPPNAATRIWNFLTDWISVDQQKRPVAQVTWPTYDEIALNNDDFL
ncbi:hypothetical protein N7540_010376 [Penicillium herquei]|nr:hypothetical protein N7540_010376 [Penicillium herquei]